MRSLSNPREVPSTTAVRAVMFDLGGTLVSYLPGMYDAYVRALLAMGVDLGDAGVREAARTAQAAVSRRYADQVSYLHRDLFRDQLLATADELGAGVTTEIVERFEREHLDNIISNTQLRSDAKSVLGELRARGLHVAVVSNADDDFLLPTLKRHGLDQLVDAWTSSEEAGSCKPDARIFQHALRKARCRPEHGLFVGDSLEHDVAGAQALGMHTALISSDQPAPFTVGLSRPAEPDLRIEALTDLVTLLVPQGDG